MDFSVHDREETKRRDRPLSVETRTAAPFVSLGILNGLARRPIVAPDWSLIGSSETVPDEFGCAVWMEDPQICAVKTNPATKNQSMPSSRHLSKDRTHIN